MEKGTPPSSCCVAMSWLTAPLRNQTADTLESRQYLIS
jgi:hypothetical protein